MEALGLAIGIAGLYSICFEAVDKARSYKEYEFESQFSILRFKISEHRLREWARNVGIADNKLKDEHHHILDNPEFNIRACQLLSMIHHIFSNTLDISLFGS